MDRWRWAFRARPGRGSLGIGTMRAAAEPTTPRHGSLRCDVSADMRRETDYAGGSWPAGGLSVTRSGVCLLTREGQTRRLAWCRRGRAAEGQSPCRPCLHRCKERQRACTHQRAIGRPICDAIVLAGRPQRWNARTRPPKRGACAPIAPGMQSSGRPLSPFFL